MASLALLLLALCLAGTASAQQCYTQSTTQACTATSGCTWVSACIIRVDDCDQSPFSASASACAARTECEWDSSTTSCHQKSSPCFSAFTAPACSAAGADCGWFTACVESPMDGIDEGGDDPCNAQCAPSLSACFSNVNCAPSLIMFVSAVSATTSCMTSAASFLSCASPFVPADADAATLFNSAINCYYNCSSSGQASMSVGCLRFGANTSAAISGRASDPANGVRASGPTTVNATSYCSAFTGAGMNGCTAAGPDCGWCTTSSAELGNGALCLSGDWSGPWNRTQCCDTYVHKDNKTGLVDSTYSRRLCYQGQQQCWAERFNATRCNAVPGCGWQTYCISESTQNVCTSLNDAASCQAQSSGGCRWDSGYCSLSQPGCVAATDSSSCAAASASLTGPGQSCQWFTGCGQAVGTTVATSSSNATDACLLRCNSTINSCQSNAICGPALTAFSAQMSGNACFGRYGACATATRPIGTSADAVAAQQLYDQMLGCYFSCQLSVRGACELSVNASTSPCRNPACFDAGGGSASSSCCDLVRTYCGPNKAGDEGCTSFYGLPGMCYGSGCSGPTTTQPPTTTPPTTPARPSPIFGNCTRLIVDATATTQVLSVAVAVLGAANNVTSVSRNITVPAGQGNITAVFTAANSQGLSSQCTLTVVAVDRTPPTITCPAAVNLTLVAGQYLANATCSITTLLAASSGLSGVGCGSAGSVADDIGVSRLTRTPPFAGGFPVGRNVMTYTVFDGRGNSASCNTTVTVMDAEAPVLSCPSGSVSLPETSTSLQTPMPVCFNVSDNDGVGRLNVTTGLRSLSYSLTVLNAALPLAANITLVRKPQPQSQSQPQLQPADAMWARFCVAIPAPAPSVQPVTIVVADRSGNTAMCTWTFTLTVSPRSAELTGLLDTLTGGPRVNSSTLAALTSSLRNLTSNVTDLTPAQYSRSAVVLQQLVNSSLGLGGPVNVTQATAMAAVFNQVCGVPRANAEAAQQSDGGLSTVRSALSLFFQSFNGTNTSFSFSGSNLDLSIRPFRSTVGNFPGYNFTAASNQTVQFQVPPLPLASVTIAFTTFPDDRLFPSVNTSGTVVSQIIDVVVVGVNTSFLSSPARFSMQLSMYSPAAKLRCVYYDTVAQAWSSEGVTTESTVGDKAYCTASHFTNFAVIVDSEAGAATGTQATALAIITLVGCCLSLGGIALTLWVHAANAALRERLSSQVLVGQCVALALALIFFIAASQMSASSTAGSCRGVGILLHYFIVASFGWMLVQGVHLQATAAGSSTEGRLKGYHLLAWGVSLVILVLSIGIGGPSSYGGDSFCWINSQPMLIGAVLVPLAVALAINLALFIIIVRSQGDASASKSQLGAAYGLKGMAAISTMMGLTWIFGLFINVSSGSSSVFLQYLFAIFATLQGLALFIFHVLLDPEAKSYASAHTLTSRKSTTPTISDSETDMGLHVNPIFNARMPSSSSQGCIDTMDP